MEPYQQRVVDEKRELDNKIDKLNQFAQNSPIFGKMNLKDQELLLEQLDIMFDYTEILSKRIERF